MRAFWLVLATSKACLRVWGKNWVQVPGRVKVKVRGLVGIVTVRIKHYSYESSHKDRCTMMCVHVRVRVHVNVCVCERVTGRENDISSEIKMSFQNQTNLGSNYKTLVK